MRYSSAADHCILGLLLHTLYTAGGLQGVHGYIHTRLSVFKQSFVLQSFNVQHKKEKAAVQAAWQLLQPKTVLNPSF